MRRALLLPVCLIVVTGALRGGTQGAPRKVKAAFGTFTISKETTYVTGPVDKDGYIDYMAALNEILSKGITPEKNANVVLWQALGPRPMGVKVAEKYFHLLGAPEPPPQGEYFIDFYDYAAKELKLDPNDFDITKEWGRCHDAPWKATEFPRIASWLKRNEKAFHLGIEGSKRSEYFSPLVHRALDEKDSATTMIATIMPNSTVRGLGDALIVRAMGHLYEGRLDDAWQDIVACHRWGRLISRGGTFIEAMVGIALEHYASAEAAALLLDRARKLDANKIRTWRKQFESSPPRGLMADHFDRYDRFMFLDAVMELARKGPGLLAKLKDDRFMRYTGLDKASEIDWDPVMKQANIWCDRRTAAMCEPDYRTRQKKLGEFARELADFPAEPPDQVLMKLLAAKTPAERGKVMGSIVLQLFLPAMVKAQQAEDRTVQIHRNLTIAFALAEYRADAGRYPPKLEDLSPKYLATIPNDLFSGKPLIYRPAKDGYLFYSVGINGVDDGGQTYNEQPQADDLRVRMPAAKQEN